MPSKSQPDSTPPSPAGVDVEIPSSDGILLKGRYWNSVQPRAVLIIAHGLGEHSGSYQRLAERLVTTGWIDVLGVDFRGSGRSPGRRGVIRKYSDLSTDLVATIDWVSQGRSHLSRFLLGHSNGGLVVLRTALDRQLNVQGLIVSNPSIMLLAHVPLWKRAVGQILLRIAPGITLPTGLSNEQLTQDPEVVAQISNDLLRHNRISSPLYFGMKDAGPVVLARASEIKTPTLMILGGSDPIIDPATNQRYFGRLGSIDKTLKIYEDMRHEPFNEIGRERVVSDLIEWIEYRLT